MVTNSKLALKTLSDLGSATKEVFLASLDLPAEVEDHTGQREMIFNALLCYHLLENGESVYRVSEKGERLLKFIGLV